MLILAATREDDGKSYYNVLINIMIFHINEPQFEAQKGG